MAKKKPQTKGIFHPNGTLRVQDPDIKARIMGGTIAELQHSNAQIDEQILHLNLRKGKNLLAIEALEAQADRENLQMEFEFDLDPPEEGAAEATPDNVEPLPVNVE